MRRIPRSALLLLLLFPALLANGPAASAGAFDLTVEPATPTSADTIRIVLEGSWTCPSLSQPEVAGQLVVLSFTECGSLAPPTHHRFERLVPPLEAGFYTLVLLDGHTGDVLHRQELHVVEAGEPSVATVVPLDPVVRLAVDGQEVGLSAPDVALRPDGGLIAVWQDIVGGQVSGATLEPAAGPEQPSEEPEVFELGEPNDATAPPVLAAAPGGVYLAVWRAGSSAVPGELVAQAFGPGGEPLAARRSITPETAAGYALAALPTGGFVVAWGRNEPDGPVVRFRLLAPLGGPTGEARMVTEEPSAATLHSGLVRVAARSDGSFVVTWTAPSSGAATAIRARGFTRQGVPLGDAFELVAVDGPAGLVEHDVAADGVGNFLLLYQDGTDRAGSLAPGAIRALRFTLDGELVGPARRIDSGGESVLRGRPAMAVTPDGRGVAAWAEQAGAEEIRVLARLVDRRGGARSDVFEVATVTGNLAHPIDVDRDAEGRMAFGWGAGLDPGILPRPQDLYLQAEVRRFLEIASTEPPPAPPVPDRPPLASAELPGFRVWVDITDQQGATVAGEEETPCIPETLCVSGRLPGRSEVFVRVIGPRPNGRLWPVLVKFTTSRVEVWIEQVETGEVEYYLLRGARPGVDELPGLFDREGFEP